MKAYVIEYGSLWEDPRLVEVRYGSELSIESRYVSRQIAEAACRKLNRFGVRVGAHHCAFSVDALPEGDFALFCVCHPRYLAARSSLFVVQRAEESAAFQRVAGA